MSRSRLLLRIAAPLFLASIAACRSGEEAASPTTTTSADSRAFPQDDAHTALNAAAPGLKACRSANGPTELDARLRFAPSGKVAAVDVTPNVEPVATCIRSKLSEVAVMPFAGEPVTVPMHVRL